MSPSVRIIDIELVGVDAPRLALFICAMDQIKNFNKITIPLKIDNKIYHISDIFKTPGTPKSDFHFVNDNNEETVWISHKYGRKASDFQQWGGVTEKEILVEKETQDFINTVQSKFPNGITRATTIARKITNDNLKMKSIYGIDYGKEFGRQNVQLVIQGNMELHANNGYYSVNATSVHVNGDPMIKDYEPALMCTYRSDRKQFNIPYARFTISPIGGRKITELI